MIRDPQGSAFIEIVIGVLFLLVAFVAITVGLPILAEYVRGVTP